MERKSLKELVAKKQIFAPTVWDVMSAKAAEACGFEATMLSGGLMSNNCATLDIGLITADDLVRITENICRASNIPCCVDSDNGYGATALHAYNTTRRLVKAGAMSLTLDDTTGTRGYNRFSQQLRGGVPFGQIEHAVVPMDTYLAKIRAGLDACAGSDCMVIARTESALQYGLDEAIERCIRAEELGAEMTVIIGLRNMEDAEYVAKYVKGWKMWPDVMAPGGVPDVELADIEKLGFNYVTAHCMTKGSNYAMRTAARGFVSARNTVAIDNYDLGLSDYERNVFAKPDLDELFYKKEEEYWKNLKHPLS